MLAAQIYVKLFAHGASGLPFRPALFSKDLIAALGDGSKDS